MILNDFTIPKTKFSNEQLDSVLVELCDIVIKGQQDNPDFNGMVAAAVIDPAGKIVTGLNYLYGARRVHGERAAIDKYEAEYGELPRGSIVVTTCSPCSCEFDDNREGPSCSELLNRKGVKLAYCGFNDPTQKNTHDRFVTIITENSKLKHLCAKFAETFLKDEITEDIPTSPRALLYHTTPVMLAMDMIDNGFIEPRRPGDQKNPKDPRTQQPSISLTRDPRLNYYRGITYRVTFGIDQEALRQQTKIYPYSYGGLHKVESEERVYAPIPLSLVRSLIVSRHDVDGVEEYKQAYKDAGSWTNDEVWNDDSYDNPYWMLDQIMIWAKKHGVKIIVK